MSVLAHNVEGEGPPLLLLNGGMMSIAAWEPIARRLAERHRVIRCDFRGQLLSPGPPRASMEEHADDVAALLDALGETRGGRRRGVVRRVRRAPPRGASSGARRLRRRGDRHGRRERDGLGEAGRGSRRPCAPPRAAATGRRSTTRSSHLAYTPEWQAAHADELAARRGQVGLLPDAWFTGLEGLLTRSRRST